MDTSLSEVGLEMYQEDEELVWALQVPGDVTLRLSPEDLEQLVYRLSDELEAMKVHRGWLELEDAADLPEGTDNLAVDLVPDSGDDLASMVGDGMDFDFND